MPANTNTTRGQSAHLRCFCWVARVADAVLSPKSHGTGDRGAMSVESAPAELCVARAGTPASEKETCKSARKGGAFSGRGEQGGGASASEAAISVLVVVATCDKDHPPRR